MSQICLLVRSQGTWWRANWRWQRSMYTSSPWTPGSLWKESLSSSWRPTSESSTWFQYQPLSIVQIINSFSVELQTTRVNHTDAGVWHMFITQVLPSYNSYLYTPASALLVVLELPCCCSTCPMDRLSSTLETSEPTPPWRRTPSYSAAGCRRFTWTPR